MRIEIISDKSMLSEDELTSLTQDLIELSDRYFMKERGVKHFKLELMEKIK